jgi:hypothetical protein
MNDQWELTEAIQGQSTTHRAVKKKKEQKGNKTKKDATRQR